MIRAIVQTHPWLIPAFLLLGLALGGGMARVARRLSLPRAHAALFGVALAAEITATLYPMHPGADASGVCTLDRDLFAPLTTGQGVMNIVMFVPVTFFAATTFRRLALPLTGCVLLSGTTELLQALAPHTGRSCATEDLVANIAGAAIGIAQATAFVRTRFPWALKDSEVTVQPPAPGSRGRTVAWRRHLDGVLMPMRMDVVVEPTGGISAFTARDQKPPADLPTPRLTEKRARRIAEDHLRTGTFTDAHLLVEKNNQGRWEVRWAVTHSLEPHPRNDSQDGPVSVTAVVNARTGEVVDIVSRP